MANLAIKGHHERGKEVIEILEMLGGRNKYSHFGESASYFFFIQDGVIDCDEVRYADGYLIYTLEQFLKKFPYKVGDKVKCTRINDFIGRVINVRWDENENQIIYVVEWDDATKSTLTYFANGLQPYKEETMEDIIKIDIPKGYEFAGVDDDKRQVVFEKIGHQYPKTYEECCEVLGYEHDEDEINCYQRQLIESFVKLLICRDAYWKIVGEQMGLGKPWEPDYTNDDVKFCICCCSNLIEDGITYDTSEVFVFPTEEMRVAFYENFKDLIEQCKELL